jgi:hypothetical protein
MPPASIPGILDVTVVRGAHAAAGTAPDLVIEVPHGATTTADFTAAAAPLTSALPDDLVAFFHVNTDAGAPELAVAIAHHITDADPARSVVVVRCRIPRTFIDCNRRIDVADVADVADVTDAADAAGAAAGGKLTPGLMPWITTDDDRARLVAAHQRYVACVHQATAELAGHGGVLLLHSYAPRTVDVEVDLDIVASLRRAYAPDRATTWPLRPEIDVIGRAPDGTDHAPAAVVAALRSGLAALGIAIADSATYPLHPGTLAWDHVVAHPGRALCVEVRRDLLADPFEPFAEMQISAAKVDRLAAPLARALARWWTTP